MTEQTIYAKCPLAEFPDETAARRYLTGLICGGARRRGFSEPGPLTFSSIREHRGIIIQAEARVMTDPLNLEDRLCIGSIVFLNSDGPPMTVIRTTSRSEVTCAWFTEDGEYHQAWLPADAVMTLSEAREADDRAEDSLNAVVN